MLGIGSLLAYANQPVELPERYLDKAVECEGEVMSYDEMDQGYQLSIKILTIDGEKVAPAQVAARYYKSDNNIKPGSVIRCKGKISFIPDAPIIPYDSYYPKWQRKNGICYSMRCKEGSIEEIKGSHGWQKLAYDVRRAMFRGIANAPINGKYASFLIAAILGDSSFIAPESHEAFRDTGTAHVLALSGLHVGILSSLLTIAFFPMRLMRRGFMYSYPLTIISIWCYAFATGLAPSVVRAAVMLSIFLMCTLMQRRSNGFNSLCVALIIILTFSPLSLFTPGFQLSFAAVANILIFMKAVPSQLRKRPYLYFCITTALVPIAAMLGTGLLSAYHFHSFPPYFLLSNIVVGLLIPWVLGAGFVLMFTTMLGLKLVILGNIATFLFTIMHGAIELLANIGTPITVGYFTAWAFVPYIFALAFLALIITRIRNSQQWHVPAALCVCCLIATGMAACGIKERAPEQELYITDGSASAIVMQDQGIPYIISLSKDGLHTTNQRLQEYRERYCAGKEFKEMPNDTVVGPFFYSHSKLVVGNKVIAIVNDAHVQHRALLSKVDYAVIGNQFVGNIAEVIRNISPDTVLLAGSISPSRERRLARECGDSIPYLSLRYRIFALEI